MWAPIHSLVASSTEDSRIPPPPTQPQFPVLSGSAPVETSYLNLPELEQIFRIKQIKQLSTDALTAAVTNFPGRTCELEDLVPPGYLPPASWQQPMTNHESGSEGSTSSEPASSQMLSNGAAVPGRETFLNRIKELSFDVDEVYKALAQQSTASNLRVVHFRHFWIQLKQVGTFWDASRDNLDFSDPTVILAHEKQREELRNSKKSFGQLDGPQSPDLKSKSPLQSQTGTSANGDATSEKPDTGTDSNVEGNTSDFPKYTGRRHSCGSEMPGSVRTGTVKAFIQPIAHAFGCLIDDNIKQQPRIRLGTTKLDVDYVARVYRGPKDRGRSRAGIREGPLLVVQCTHDLDFGRANNETTSPSIDVPYIGRELGALMAIALERDREARTEEPFGKGQWWAEAPRTGASSGLAVGLPLLEENGTPVQEPVVSVEVTEAGKEPSKKEKGRSTTQKEIRKNVRRKLLARAHQPPESVWEKSVDYVRVGMAEDDVLDTIFLLSCLNHHVALVRMDVHPKFLAHLDRNRTQPLDLQPGQPPPDWYGVRLSRSRWHDLFKEQERVAIARALWGTMGWLMRRTGSGEEMEIDQ